MIFPERSRCNCQNPSHCSEHEFHRCKNDAKAIETKPGVEIYTQLWCMSDGIEMHFPVPCCREMSSYSQDTQLDGTAGSQDRHTPTRIEQKHRQCKAGIFELGIKVQGYVTSVKHLYTVTKTLLHRHYYSYSFKRNLGLT